MTTYISFYYMKSAVNQAAILVLLILFDYTNGKYSNS